MYFLFAQVVRNNLQMNASFDELFDSEVTVNIFKLRDAARLGVPTPGHRRAIYRYLLGVAMPDRSREMKIEKAQEEAFQELLTTHERLFKKAPLRTTMHRSTNYTGSMTTTTATTGGGGTGTSSTSSSTLPTAGESVGGRTNNTGVGEEAAEDELHVSGSGAGNGNPSFFFSSYYDRPPLPSWWSSMCSAGDKLSDPATTASPYCGTDTFSSSATVVSTTGGGKEKRKPPLHWDMSFTPTLAGRACIGGSGAAPWTWCRSFRGRLPGDRGLWDHSGTPLMPWSTVSPLRVTPSTTFQLFRSSSSPSGCQRHPAGGCRNEDVNEREEDLYVSPGMDPDIRTLEWSRWGGNHSGGGYTGSSAIGTSGSTHALFEGEEIPWMTEWVTRKLEAVGPLAMSDCPREAWRLLVHVVQEAYPVHRTDQLHWCSHYLQQHVEHIWKDETPKHRGESISSGGGVETSSSTSTTSTRTGKSTSHGGPGVPHSSWHAPHHSSSAHTMPSSSSSTSTGGTSEASTLPSLLQEGWQRQDAHSKPSPSSVRPTTTAGGSAALPPMFFSSSSGLGLFHSMGLPFVVAERRQTLSQCVSPPTHSTSTHTPRKSSHNGNDGNTPVACTSTSTISTVPTHAMHPMERQEPSPLSSMGSSGGAAGPYYAAASFSPAFTEFTTTSTPACTTNTNTTTSTGTASLVSSTMTGAKPGGSAASPSSMDPLAYGYPPLPASTSSLSISAASASGTTASASSYHSSRIHSKWMAYLRTHIQKVRDHHLLALAALQLYYKDMTVYAFLYQVVPLTFPLAPLFFSDTRDDAKELFFASYALVSTLRHPLYQNILQNGTTRQMHCGEFLSLFRWTNPTLYRHFHIEEVRAVDWVPAFLGSLGVGFLQDPENVWRLWDYYLADASTHHRFPLHPYVCLALLMAMTEKLIECDREEILFHLRLIPSMDMTSILRQAVALQENSANLLQSTA